MIHILRIFQHMSNLFKVKEIKYLVDMGKLYVNISIRNTLYRKLYSLSSVVEH